ncbi:MAG: Dabb family protein [Nitrospirales bacterium]|nr:Dabb family protein [Nitrospirales bacterium]
MIKHIVMWRLRDEAGGKSKAENALIIKERLEALAGRIPGLLRIEVGIDFSATAESGDVLLYSEFESPEALDAYQNHPEHKAVVPFIGEVRSERRVVDYKC